MSFESWFSGSKVVDKNGKPLVVFHGTQSSEHFTVFRTDGHEWVMDDDAEEEFVDDMGSGAEPNSFLGAHFTEDREVASRFASGDIDWLKRRYIGKQVKGEHGRVIPVYLKIKNPTIFGNEEDLDDFIYSQSSNDELVELHLGGLSYDLEMKEEELFEKYDNDSEFRTEVNRDIVAAGFYNEPEEIQGMVEFTRDLAHSARKVMVKKGHDGVKYKNDIEGGIAWIAFTPQQIKSAYSKSFTDDPDITKESIQRKIRRFFIESNNH